MALFIDTPRWWWRGRLWAHLISDVSVDELHDAAAALGLRYLSFGRDHYDVPEELWPDACEVADLVDSRRLVRSLRQSGLRVPGGKSLKTWVPLSQIPASGDRSGALGRPQLESWFDQVRRLSGAEVEVLARPGEAVLFGLVRSTRPNGADAVVQSGRQLAAQTDNGRLVETIAGESWSVELVFNTH